MLGLTHLLPDIRTGHSEVTTSAFFGGAQIVSHDIIKSAVFTISPLRPLLVHEERFELSRLSALVSKTSVATVTPLVHYIKDSL